MTVTLVSFRAQFPEFASTADYPDTSLTPWLAVAVKFVNAARWGTLSDFGVSLWLAHNLVVNRANVRAAAAGKAPGGSSGVVSSKSVDSASISFDTVVAAEKDAGWWNLSNYGKQFYRYSQMMGAGPLEVDAPPAGASMGVSAWQGVMLPYF